MSPEDKKRIEQDAYDYAMIPENAPVWGDPELAVFGAAKAAYIAGAEAEQLFKQRQNAPTENERFEIWCEIIDFVIQTRLTGSTWKELDSKYSIERK